MDFVCSGKWTELTHPLATQRRWAVPALTFAASEFALLQLVPSLRVRFLINPFSCFLLALRRVRKICGKRLLALSCPVCPNGTSRPPTGRIFMKFYISVFFEKYLENSTFFKIWLEKRVLYMTTDLCTFMIISRWIFLRMRNVSDRRCTKNQNTFYAQ